MRANLNKLNLIYTAFFICTFIFFTSCPKETCNANFSTSYSNGGMAPENVTLAAHDSSQDSYEWSIDGNPFNGTPQTIAFATSGNFNVTLDVNKGDKSCQESDVIEIRDYPYRGYMTQDGEEVGRAISYFQGDGTLSTMVLADGSEPCIIIPNGVPLNIDGLGGLAYHSAEKKLYVTPNAPDRPGVTVLNCFPNGVAVKEFIGGDDFGIFDFVLDENTNIGYYSIRFGGNAAIIKVDLNNQDLAPEPFHNSFEFGNIFFAFDFANNKIYYSAQNGIVTVNEFGQISGESDYGIPGSKHSVEFDPTTGMLYFSQFSSIDGVNNIYRVDPTDLQNVAEPLLPMAETSPEGFPIEGMDIDERNQEIFWSDKSCGCIKRMNLNDRSDISIVVDGLNNPRAIVVGIFEK